MKKFGVSIQYKIVELINIFINNDINNFISLRNEYLRKENEDINSPLYRIDEDKIKKNI